MRRFIVIGLAPAMLLPSSRFAAAQSSIDALERELTTAQQNHVDVSNKIVAAFFAQADAGMVSPEAAIALYTDPAGINQPPPPLAPVVTKNEHENATEKEARVAIDQLNLARFGAALQLHCGMLHYGGLFVLDPDRKGLQQAWVQWLKAAVPIYLQMSPPVDHNAAPAPDPAPSPANDANRHHKHDQDPSRERDKISAYVPTDVKNKSLHDSLITKFNNFSGFNGKDQGGWSVKQIPALYRASVLEPLRVKPNAETLAAWDSVIAMASIDESDNDHWNNEVAPGLQFDRASDAYAIAPSTEGLLMLVNYIKQYPAHPRIEDWITRVQGFVKTYRASHGGAAAQTAAPVAPASNSGVNVTTEQQGDMTIITTHTNSPSNTPPPH